MFVNFVSDLTTGRGDSSGAQTLCSAKKGTAELPRGRGAKDLTLQELYIALQLQDLLVQPYRMLVLGEIVTWVNRSTFAGSLRASNGCQLVLLK